MLRRALQQALGRLRFSIAADSAACKQWRGYARLPGEVTESAAKFPNRSARRPTNDSNAAVPEAHAAPAGQQPAAAPGATDAAAAAPAAEAAAGITEATAGPAPGSVAAIVGETQRESARVATAFMFPWERRQMEGGKLKTWEKFYWGVFAVAMASLLFNRLSGSKKEPPKVDEEKEAKKAEQARLMLAGKSFLEDDDIFKGMTPKEIQEYVSNATQGADTKDPFEGMSPEEINEYVARHGMPADMQ